MTIDHKRENWKSGRNNKKISTKISLLFLFLCRDVFWFRWFCNWILALALNTHNNSDKYGNGFVVAVFQYFFFFLLLGRCHFYHETVWFNSKRQLIIFRLRALCRSSFFIFFVVAVFVSHTLYAQVQCSRFIMLWNNFRIVLTRHFVFRQRRRRSTSSSSLSRSVFFLRTVQCTFYFHTFTMYQNTPIVLVQLIDTMCDAVGLQTV